MDFDWKAIVKTVAPALATALGGPLAGVAVTTIAGALLGKPNATEAEIAEAVQYGGVDALLALKKADQDFAIKMRELDVEDSRVAMQDRASARQREVDTKDSTTPRVLAAIFTAGFFFVLGWLMYKGPPAEGHEALLVLLGALSAGQAAILSFYFGSSASSASKNATIQRLAEPKP